MTTSPVVNTTKAGAIVTSPLEEQRVLLVGQKTVAGSATPGTLVQNIGNSGEEDTLFGANSMLADMVRVFKRENTDTRLDAIPLADDGGATAAGAIDVIIGAATAPGTITYEVGSSSKSTFTIDIAIGDDPDIIGPKVASAINADTKLQITGAYNPALDEVGFLADNEGLEGNFFTIKVTSNTAGITHTLTGFTGGATNPSLTGIFDVIDDLRYQWIAWPTSYDVSTVRDFLEARYNTDNNILNGRVIQYKSDTFANLKTLASAENARTLNFWGSLTDASLDQKGNSIVEFPASISSYLVSLFSKRLTVGAQISEIVTNGAALLDRFGGPALASRPLFNTPFVNLPVLEQRNKLTETEIQELLDSGMSTFVNNKADTVLTIRDAVTTYKTDLAGNPDISFKFLNYEMTLSIIAEVFFNRIKDGFPQARLSRGSLPGLRDGVTEDIFAAYLDSVYLELAGEDFVLVDPSDEAIQFFKDNRTILIDFANGKITADLTLPIIVQARRFDIFIRPTFDI